MIAMNEHRSHAVVQAGGSVTVTNLPLRPGQQVEVIVVPVRAEPTNADEIRATLRNSVLQFDDPFGPATSNDDWDALR